MWIIKEKKVIQMIKLEQYRLLKGMTVYGLSKATGISRRHI